MNTAYLGIEIGGTKIQVLATDMDFKELECIKFHVGDTKQASVILDGLQNNLIPLLSKYSFHSIGVGFGGPVNAETGEIYQSFHVNGWESTNLKNWISKKTDASTYVDNDANVAALGEATLGAGKGYNRVFYITMGSGVGGGFVLNGEIYHGKEPSEFEIGHIRLSKSEVTMESSCSGWALNKKLESYIRIETESPLAQLVKKSKTDCTKNLTMALEQNDMGAKNILDDTIDDLALGLSHMVHIVNPEIIIIGGGLSNLGGYLTTTLTEFLPRYLMDTMKTKLPKIELSQLQELAVPLGAVVYGALEKQRSKKQQ